MMVPEAGVLATYRCGLAEDALATTDGKLIEGSSELRLLELSAVSGA